MAACAYRLRRYLVDRMHSSRWDVAEDRLEGASQNELQAVEDRTMSVSRAISFSEAIHFSIVTMSTVGYGDIVPATNLARLLASMEVICGVTLLLFGVSELLEYTREHRRDRAGSP